LVKDQFKIYDPVKEQEIFMDSWDFWKRLVDLGDHVGVE
jgi:hypothetical protein